MDGKKLMNWLRNKTSNSFRRKAISKKLTSQHLHWNFVSRNIVKNRCFFLVPIRPPTQTQPSHSVAFRYVHLGSALKYGCSWRHWFVMYSREFPWASSSSGAGLANRVWKNASRCHRRQIHSFEDRQTVWPFIPVRPEKRNLSRRVWVLLSLYQHRRLYESHIVNSFPWKSAKKDKFSAIFDCKFNAATNEHATA